MLICVYCFNGIPGFSGSIELNFVSVLSKVIPLSGTPINFPLWFLRDLIFIFILSPIIIVFLKEIPWFSMVILGYLWLKGINIGLFNNPSSYFWFYIGCIIKYKNIKLDFIDRNKGIIVILYAISTTIISYCMFIEYAIPNYFYIFNFNIFIGIMALWGIAGTKIFQNRVISFFVGDAFFIYLWHEPLLSLFQTYVCLQFDFSSTISQLILYFGSALIIFLFLSLLNHFLKRNSKYIRIKQETSYEKSSLN